MSDKKEAIFVSVEPEEARVLTHYFHVLLNIDEDFPRQVSTPGKPQLSGLVWEAVGSLTCGIDKIAPARTPFSADQDFGPFLFAGLNVVPYLVELGFRDLSKFCVRPLIDHGANPPRALAYDWPIGNRLLETISGRG